MTRSLSVRWACCALGTFLLASPLVSSQSVKPDARGFIAAQPEDLQPPDGGRQIVILGDPGKAGMYVMRTTFPAGQGTRPHFHSQDRYVTVIKGTWWVALGPNADVYDPNNMVPMKPGSFIFHPANGHHYDGTRTEDVTVQIIGMGPVTSTQVSPDAGRAPGP